MNKPKDEELRFKNIYVTVRKKDLRKYTKWPTVFNDYEFHAYQHLSYFYPTIEYLLDLSIANKLKFDSWMSHIWFNEWAETIVSSYGQNHLINDLSRYQLHWKLV